MLLPGLRQIINNGYQQLKMKNTPIRFNWNFFIQLFHCSAASYSARFHNWALHCSQNRRDVRQKIRDLSSKNYPKLNLI